MAEVRIRSVAVVGQGYVGLPLSIALSKVGLEVTGVEKNQELVSRLRRGESHVQDIDSHTLLDAIDSGLTFTSKESAIRGLDAVIVCVPTPLLDSENPDLRPLEEAFAAIIPHLRHRSLVVLESTSFPGTTSELLLPKLQAKLGKEGEDFFLAFSPERIDPGNQVYSISNTPRVVGGVTRTCSEVAASLYRNVVSEVHIVRGPSEAEMAKLLENTYRHVNIALVNELAKVCHSLGINVWEVIAAASTKPFGFQAFFPGPGVGGHCIPIDPVYLNSRVRSELGRPFHFIELATAVNREMPSYVVNRIIEQLEMDGLASSKRVLLLGLTYKPDIGDLRESPSLQIALGLRLRNIEVLYHDPFVDQVVVGDELLRSEPHLEESARQADLTVLLQNHSVYSPELLLLWSRKLFDTRGVVPGAAYTL